MIYKIKILKLINHNKQALLKNIFVIKSQIKIQT
jgi:hypothetical protein